MDPKDRLKKEIFAAIANIANDAIEDSDGIEDHTSEYDHDDFITTEDLENYDYTTEDDVRTLISDDPELVSASTVKGIEREFKEQIEGFNERLNEVITDYHSAWASQAAANTRNRERFDTLTGNSVRLGKALTEIEGFNERVDEFNKKESLFRYEMDTRVASCEDRCKELDPVISTGMHNELKRRIEKLEIRVDTLRDEKTTVLEILEAIVAYIKSA